LGNLPECCRKRLVFGGDPKTILQEGKKGVGGLVIVFMEIRAVTEFSGEIGRGESGESPRIVAGIK
jgi:hypothetical protein